MANSTSHVVLLSQCTLTTDQGIFENVMFAALNILLSIAAVLGNVLILAALRKESSLHLSTKLLFRCLASTDFCVGLIPQPLYVAYLVSLTKQYWKLCYFSYISTAFTGVIFSGVSLFILTAISVDRLLALMLRLRYRQVVTVRRVRIVIVSTWLCSGIFVGLSIVLRGNGIGSFISAMLLLCILTSSFCYLKMFHKLRQHKNQVHGSVRQQLSQTDGAQAPQPNGAQVPQLNGPQVPQHNGAQIPQLNGPQFAKSNGAQVPQLNGAQIPKHNGAQILQLNGAQFAEPNGAQVPQRNGAQIPKTNRAQLPQLNESQLAQPNYAQVPQQNGAGSSSLNIARYRRTVSTALLLQLTLLACYFPFYITLALAASLESKEDLPLAFKFTVTLVYLNSSLNPIFYCWKIREVRQAARDTIRQWVSLIKCSN